MHITHGRDISFRKMEIDLVASSVSSADGVRRAGSYMPASTWPKSNSKPGKTADGTGVVNA